MRVYDVIGDIHGCADQLEGLLTKLGYEELEGVYRPQAPDEDRQVIFVGDLIDRGTQQVRVLELVRAMVDAGSAQVVMGNHEFNAISFATPNPEIPGEFMRRHTVKNCEQHQAFLDQIQAHPGLYARTIEWFRTLPPWLDLEELRVIHACWNGDAMDHVRQGISPGTEMSTEFIVKANTKGSPEYEAIEVLLKGPELSLTKYGQPGFQDRDDHVRYDARIRWWNSRATNLRDAAEIPTHSRTPAGEEYPILPTVECLEGAAYKYQGEKPVFYGHYWREWKPKKGTDWTENTVCVDFSAVKGGPLVAYRWRGPTAVSENGYIGFP